MLASTLQQGSNASQQETQHHKGHKHGHRQSRPGPGLSQGQGHTITSGSNKRKISSKDITPALNGQQLRQQQPPQSKYIEFQHAMEQSTRQARHQDDTRRTLTEKGHQRQLKGPLTSHYDNSGSQGITSQFQGKGVRLGSRANPLPDFENNHSSNRSSRGREQFSQHSEEDAAGYRGISPVSNARNRQREGATRERPRHGDRGEPCETASAPSPLLTNGESGTGAQSWNRPYQPPVTSARTNDVLTIRDILDSQEIRDQISELRRSLNSNADHRDPGASSRQNEYHNGSRVYGDLSSATSAVSFEPKRSRTDQRFNEPRRNEATRIKPRGEGTATDLSMDESLLEEKFRKRLDAAIPIMESSKAGPSGTAMAVGQSAKESRTTAVAVPIDSEVVNKQTGATTKQRQDLYHSSYSPTEFSDAEDQDDNEDDNEDEDEDEGQGTVELKRHDINDKDNDRSQPPPPQPQTQPTSLQTREREGLWESNAIAHQRKSPANPVRAKENRDHDPRRASGDISFEREVALARAKRELKASLNHTGGQRVSEQAKPDGTHSDINHSNMPSSPVLSVSRLDRGRDLALEDLVSPTRFNFGSRHSSQHHQYDPTAPAGFSSAAPTASGHNWGSAPTFPLLSTAEDLAQLNIATGAEERFLEMAGAFGEGQAVASIFGTLKGMIRQVKTEKKLLEKANQKLQKELRKTRRDLERSRKANEKMLKTDHTTQSSTHTKPGRSDEDGEPESVSAQKEKDKIARNMVAFQKRIDALEMQRAELQVREQLRAKEEANLMLLIDSDDDSQQEEGVVESESESGSESVKSDGDYAKVDKTPRQIQSVCSDSEHSIMQRPHGQRGARVSRHSSTKPPLASSLRPPSSKLKEGQEFSGASRCQTKPGRKKAHSKSVHRPEPRQFVEKVEEVVHIHHHVYYGDDDQHDDPSPISKPRPVDASRRSAAVHLRNLTHSEYAESSEGKYHFRPGTGREIDDQPRHQPPGQNSVPQRVSEPSHIPYGGDTPNVWNQRIHYDSMTAAQQHGTPVQPFQRSQFYHNDLARPEPEPEHVPVPQRSRVVTIVDGGEANARYGTTASRAFTVSQGVAFHELGIPLPNSTSAKQRRISINLRRILSLLKTHDPKRCTVCSCGGDGQDHERHHQEHVRQSLSMLKIDGKPVRIRQKWQDAASVPLSKTTTQTHLQRRSTAAPVSPEDSGSSSFTESDPDSRDTPDVDDGENQDLPYPIRQPSSAATTTSAHKTGLAKNVDSSSASKQKLHVVLRELEEEVRHLRKSYFELHHDLETIGQNSVRDFAVDRKGKGRALDGGSSSTAAVTGALAEETAAAEQRCQQKKLIREQLLKVVDSLGEKTDEIMRLQQQQEQRLQNKSNSKKTPRSVQCLRTSTSGTRNDTRRSDKDRHEKHDPHDDTTTATSKLDLDNEQVTDESGGQQATAEQEKGQDTDTSDSQGTARPRRRHPDRKSKASRMEQEKEQRSQSKEPEGYRHRLANGFRVPKLH